MPVYRYTARDSCGKPVGGTVEASGQDELLAKLHQMGYLPTRVAEVSFSFSFQPLFEKFHRVSSEEMVMFILQLSSLIGSGIPILASLESLYQQIENKEFKKVIGSVVSSVEGGDSFSQALARHPQLFPAIFVHMVRAGEVSGRLETILARYAEFSERQADMQQKVKGALFYPGILLCAGVAVILFIVTFVIPQFAGIFVKAGIKLPLPTVILYNIGKAIKQFWFLALFGFVALGAGTKYFAGRSDGRFFFDRLKLRLPLVGMLFRKVAISRFTRTLGILVGSGVPVLASLAIAKEVCGNEVIGRVVADVSRAAERGEKISDPLKASKEFPSDTVQMIAVGEETGNLDGMLSKAADFYDMSVEYSIKKLTTLIEPLFLVVIGTLIGFIMASMLLPIFDMMKILRH
jgi:type IV pilus assembly protein PilC